MSSDKRKHGETFADIYRSVCDQIRSNYPETAGSVPQLEAVALAEQCCVGVSKQDLLKIESNKDFVDMIYFKLLDRPANQRDIRAVAGRLDKKKQTREQEIQKILESPEYADKKINVTLN